MRIVKGRRSTIVLLSLLSILPFLERMKAEKEKTIEALDVSAYFAPHISEFLKSGVPLSIARQAGNDYVIYDDFIVGRLPDHFRHASGAPTARVAKLELDENGRTHLYVAMGSASSRT